MIRFTPSSRCATKLSSMVFVGPPPFSKSTPFSSLYHFYPNYVVVDRGCCFSLFVGQIMTSKERSLRDALAKIRNPRSSQVVLPFPVAFEHRYNQKQLLPFDIQEFVHLILRLNSFHSLKSVLRGSEETIKTTLISRDTVLQELEENWSKVFKQRKQIGLS